MPSFNDTFKNLSGYVQARPIRYVSFKQESEKQDKKKPNPIIKHKKRKANQYYLASSPRMFSKMLREEAEVM